MIRKTEVRVEELSVRIKDKRGLRGLRETASEIGIGSATLSRVENGKQPDLDTFKLLCAWLNVDPAYFLGLQTASSPLPSITPEKADVAVYAHFRAHKTMNPDTANHLAKLIMTVQGLSERTS